MSMGGQSTSSTQTQTVPSWLSEGQQNLVGTAQNLTGPFLNLPAYQVAGFTPDQTNAFDLARTMAMNTFTQPSQQVDPNNAMMSAQQTTGPQIQNMQNPYTQSVVGATLNNMNNQKAVQGAQIGAQAAASGAFGGSREAVQRSLLDKNFTNTAAQTVAQLMAQGYDQATATAMANTNLRQQAGSQNASTALQLPQINAGLTGTQQNQQANALNMLLGTGGAQQQLAQQSLNVPWTTLQQLSSILSPTLNNTDKTVTGSSTSSGSAGAMQILGLVGSLFCHVAGTKIRMDDGALKNVEDLKIGDKTLFGGPVIGRGEVLASDIYEYRGTKLNGRHAVFENGKFIRAEDSPLAKETDESATVYPVVTENHLLVTENYICADLAEHDEDIGAEGRLSVLNKNTKRLDMLTAAERVLWPTQAAA